MRRALRLQDAPVARRRPDGRPGSGRSLQPGGELRREPERRAAPHRPLAVLVHRHLLRRVVRQPLLRRRSRNVVPALVVGERSVQVRLRRPVVSLRLRDERGLRHRQRQRLRPRGTRRRQRDGHDRPARPRHAARPQGPLPRRSRRRAHPQPVLPRQVDVLELHRRVLGPPGVPAGGRQVRHAHPPPGLHADRRLLGRDALPHPQHVPRPDRRRRPHPRPRRQRRPRNGLLRDRRLRRPRRARRLDARRSRHGQQGRPPFALPRRKHGGFRRERPQALHRVPERP